MAANPLALQLVHSIDNISKLMLDATKSMQAAGQRPGKGKSMSLLQCDQQLMAIRIQLKNNSLTHQPDWPLAALATGTPAAAPVQAAHARLVISFGRFVQVFVPTVQRLIAAMPIPSRMESVSCSVKMALLEETWAFASNVCCWMGGWSPFVRCTDVIDLAALKPVMNSFVAWLLQFLRQGGAVHCTLRSKMGIAGFAQSVYKLICPSLLLLCNLDQHTGAGLFLSVSSFPPGFISSLCCLVCDTAPGAKQPGDLHDDLRAVSAKMYTKILSNLSVVLSGVVLAHFTPNSQFTLNADLVSPAAVEVLKRTVCCAGRAPGVALQDKICLQSALGIVLTYVDQTNNASQSKPVPVSSSSLIPSFLTPDQEVLAPVMELSQGRPETLLSTAAAISGIMKGWVVAGPFFTGLSPQGLACLPAVLLFCSHHMCCFMQQQQDEQQREKPAWKQPCRIPSLRSYDASVHLNPVLMVLQQATTLYTLQLSVAASELVEDWQGCCRAADLASGRLTGGTSPVVRGIAV